MVLSLNEAKTFFDVVSNQKSFESFSANSTVKVFWKCGLGHSWVQPFRQFLQTNGCQVCSGRKILVGFNDLKTIHPHLAAEFDSVLNAPYSQEDFSFGSTRKVWWRCYVNQNHTWQDSYGHRINGERGCPYCSGKQVLIGDNDVATLYPHLVTEFNESKNSFKLTEVTAGSGKKAWWVCDKGHEWETAIYNRTKVSANSCPFCVGRSPIAGINDVSSSPILAFWDYEKNSINPEGLSLHSHKNVHWKDSCGHEWEASIRAQNRFPYCPYCRGRKILPGFNDLATTNPKLAKEWHPTKNLLPASDYSKGSERKVWWLGDCGHEWEASVNNRVAGNACPVCWSMTHSSKPEKELIDFFELAGVNVIQSDRIVLNGKEIDVYLPDYKIGVEFNGLYWHSEATGKVKTYHYDKYLAAKQAGIQLLQIWEDDWNRNPELIKRMLAHKLGVSQQQRTYARKSIIMDLTTIEAQEFLNVNHIQGFASGSYYLGLKDELGNLCAVLVLKKEPDNTLNIVRYATSQQVVGGFTKLLKYTEREYTPARFITFADHTISDGGLYENNGFIADKELPPDYMYVIKGERKHKFGYRLKRFKNDPDLIWQEGLSERELALLNNIPRIWDAGKTRYVRKISKTQKQS